MHLRHNSWPFLPPASCLVHCDSGMRRNQNFEFLSFWARKWPTSLGFSIFGILFSPFLFLLFFCFCCSDWPSTGLACASEKASLRRVIFSMEHPGVVAGNFAPSFSLNFLSIFVHIWGSIAPITLIWASLERSPPPAEVEYRWCQFWSKAMTSEEEERLSFVTGGYRRHRCQWVKEHTSQLLSGILLRSEVHIIFDWSA